MYERRTKRERRTEGVDAEFRARGTDFTGANPVADKVERKPNMMAVVVRTQPPGEVRNRRKSVNFSGVAPIIRQILGLKTSKKAI